MNIKGNSDDKLPLNKTVEIPTITIVVRTVFLENDKYYPLFIRWMPVQNIKIKSKNEK